MRGKDNLRRKTVQGTRITPAYAGKRAYFAVEVPSVRDHPRLCGEKFSSMSEVDIISGSPPPMRGKGGKPIFKAYDCRITPAYAGKSSHA